MELFFKAVAVAMVTAVLALALAKQGKDFALLLSMAGCVLIGLLLFHFLEPVLDFLRALQTMGDLNGQMLSILLKIVGVGLVSELASMICTDAGNGSLGKVLQILSTGVILWQSIPVFQMLIDLLNRILGEI